MLSSLPFFISLFPVLPRTNHPNKSPSSESFSQGLLFTGTQNKAAASNTLSLFLKLLSN